MENAEEAARIFAAGKQTTRLEILGNSNTPRSSGLKSQLSDLMANRNFLLLAFTWVMQMSVQAVWATVFDALCKPYDYSSFGSSLVAVSFYVSGLIGSFLFSAIVDKYKCFNRIIQSLVFFSGLSIASLRVTLPS